MTVLVGKMVRTTTDNRIGEVTGETNGPERRHHQILVTYGIDDTSGWIDPDCVEALTAVEYEEYVMLKKSILLLVEDEDETKALEMMLSQGKAEEVRSFLANILNEIAKESK